MHPSLERVTAVLGNPPHMSRAQALLLFSSQTAEVGTDAANRKAGGVTCSPTLCPM